MQPRVLVVTRQSLRTTVNRDFFFFSFLEARKQITTEDQRREAQRARGVLRQHFGWGLRVLLRHGADFDKQIWKVMRHLLKDEATVNDSKVAESGDKGRRWG